MKTTFGATTAAFLLFVSLAIGPVKAAASFNGRFFTGEGDFLSTPIKLCNGLEKHLSAWQGSSDPRKR